MRPRPSAAVHLANQGHGIGGGGEADLSFARYLELSREEEEAAAAEAQAGAGSGGGGRGRSGAGRRYLFDRRAYPGLADDYKHPPPFERPEFTRSRPQREANALFYHGVAGTGTFCHQHSSAYNAMLWGRKRWFLFPPSAHVGAAEPPFVQHAPTDMATWLNTTLPSLPTKPAQCVQEPGELLWLPDGFLHCVLNLRESVGVAIEIGPEARPMGYAPAPSGHARPRGSS